MKKTDSKQVLVKKNYTLSGKDFDRAGDASAAIKDFLKQVHIDPEITRRIARASFEAEMNVVMYADEAVITFILTPDSVRIRVKDEGPGIPDIEQAMREGFSTATDEMRAMGFGLGMGLPNIRKNADKFHIESKVGEGTTVEFLVYTN